MPSHANPLVETYISICLKWLLDKEEMFDTDATHYAGVGRHEGKTGGDESKPSQVNIDGVTRSSNRLYIA